MGEREGVFLGEKEARDEVQALAEEEQLIGEELTSLPQRPSGRGNWGRFPWAS